MALTGPAAKRVQQDIRQLQQRSTQWDSPRLFGLECVNDNVAVWQFKLRDFDSSVPASEKLNEDLKWLEGRGQEGCIKMEVRFPWDYPNQPFFLRVVKPWMKMYTGHVTAGGSFCMRALTAGDTEDCWNPSRKLVDMLPFVFAHMLHSAEEVVQTMTGPGGKGGPLAIDTAWRVGQEYSLAEAEAAFRRTLDNHGWGKNSGGAGPAPVAAPAANPPASASAAAAAAAAAARPPSATAAAQPQPPKHRAMHISAAAAAVAAAVAAAPAALASPGGSALGKRQTQWRITDTEDKDESAGSKQKRLKQQEDEEDESAGSKQHRHKRRKQQAAEEEDLVDLTGDWPVLVRQPSTAAAAAAAAGPSSAAAGPSSAAAAALPQPPKHRAKHGSVATAVFAAAVAAAPAALASPGGSALGKRQTQWRITDTEDKDESAGSKQHRHQRRKQRAAVEEDLVDLTGDWPVLVQQQPDSAAQRQQHAELEQLRRRVAELEEHQGLLPVRAPAHWKAGDGVQFVEVPLPQPPAGGASAAAAAAPAADSRLEALVHELVQCNQCSESAARAALQAAGGDLGLAVMALFGEDPAEPSQWDAAAMLSLCANRLTASEASFLLSQANGDADAALACLAERGVRSIRAAAAAKRQADQQQCGLAAEAEEVLKLVDGNAGTYGIGRQRVRRIERVQNLALLTDYRRCVRKMEQQGCGGSGSVNEKRLWHGSNSAVLAEITRTGFDFRVSALGGMLGQGTYFSESSLYSSSFALKGALPGVAAARPPPSAPVPAVVPGCQAMLLCTVAVGTSAPGTSQLRRPPAGYDSVHGAAYPNTPSGPQNYAVFDNHQAYPAYVLHFQ